MALRFLPVSQPESSSYFIMQLTYLPHTLAAEVANGILEWVSRLSYQVLHILKITIFGRPQNMVANPTTGIDGKSLR